MVRIAHRRYDFTFDVLLANGTFGSECFLIINNTVVVIVLGEEPANCQRFVALDALKAALVEVFVGHPQNLARTLLLAFSTVDFCFTCGDGVIYYEMTNHIAADDKARNEHG